MVRAFVNSSHLVTGVPGSALILSDHEDGKAVLWASASSPVKWVGPHHQCSVRAARVKSQAALLLNTWSTLQILVRPRGHRASCCCAENTYFRV